MEIKDDIKGLKEESKIYEREILSNLLEISKSFSDNSIDKEKRDEKFKKIDELRIKVKDIENVILDIEERKYDVIYKDIMKENSTKIESEYGHNDQNLNFKKIEVVEKEESINNDKPENIITEEVSKEDLEDIDKVINNMKTDNNFEEEVETKIKDEEDIDENINTNIEKIDKLINDAKELNNNIIKFPKENITRRRGYIKDNNIEEELDSTLENEYNQKEENIDIESEPVPVLFGNRSRVQNQMIVRKKSNSFSDKIRSLVFKIKTLLGTEDEEED